MGNLAGFRLDKVLSVIFHVYLLKKTNNISPTFEYVMSAIAIQRYPVSESCKMSWRVSGLHHKHAG
jgi:hypothetical protein